MMEEGKEACVLSTFYYYLLLFIYYSCIYILNLGMQRLTGFTINRALKMSQLNVPKTVGGQNNP